MTHSKPITTEAAILSSQTPSSQGISAKGKKGKQSLFSKLLATLGQGKQQQATNPLGESKKQSIKVSSNPDVKQNQKTLTLTTFTTQGSKSSKLLGTTKESNSDKNRTSENIVNQNIQVMTSLQDPLTIQNLLQSKSNDSVSVLSTKTQVNPDFTPQGVQALNVSAREPSVELQAMPQSIPKDIQKLGVPTHEISMKQTAAPSLIANTEKQTSEKLQASVSSSKEVPTSLMTGTNQTKPTIQTGSQETLGLLQNKTTITSDKGELGLQNNNGIDSTPTKNVTRIRTTQSSDITDLESTIKEKIPVQTNKVEPQIEKSRGQSTTEPQLATLTKASMSKTQTNQSIDQTGIANISSTSLAKITDVGNNTSQQDFSSDQQDLSALNIDGNKHENKLKGADFQAQLAYKSQRTFTPADAMLEVVKSAKDGSTTLELQLEPAHLGKVQVQIQMDAAKHIQVTFTVDQQTSKQALEQQMPQLRLALSQQGLDLGSFSMQMNQQQHQEQQSPRSSANTSTWTNQNLEDETQNNQIGINLATDGRLSILA